ncbi:MAG: (d)CMP kinase [Chloroflexota bacterium]
MSEAVRIQKVLADAGVASRRGADALVAAGRVRVNGRPAVTGERVDPAIDRIAVDDREIGARATPVHLALHKPAGVTSTVADRHALRTVIELVPAELRRGAPRLYPVGRLDVDSEGLLLLTNDGAWADRVLHPRYGVEREYAVGLAAPLTLEQVADLRAGIALDEGIATVRAMRPATDPETARLDALTGIGSRDLTWVRVTLTQGWKRQVRRMFAAVGASVVRLVRVRIGSLRLDDLAAGAVRPLSAAERDRLAGGQGAGGQGAGAPRAGDHGRARLPPAVEGAASAGRGRPAPRRRVVVSIDGPGASGKSSVGAAAAAAVGYRFCDTGILYRALAHAALLTGADPAESAALVALVPRIRLASDAAGRLARVLLDGADVTGALHTAAVDRVVSVVAEDAAVRAALLPVQRALATGGAIVMAGRDIGTVVLPDADLRIWLEVSLAERAARRARQRGLAPDGPDGIAIREDLDRRDGRDRERAVAPLRIPDGAHVIAADGLDLDRTVAAVVAAIRTAERTEGSR